MKPDQDTDEEHEAREFTAEFIEKNRDLYDKLARE